MKPALASRILIGRIIFMELYMQRPSGRSVDQLREVTITRQFTRHAEGSVLVCFGETQVICTASVEKGVPGFMRGEGRG